VAGRSENTADRKDNHPATPLGVTVLSLLIASSLTGARVENAKEREPESRVA